MSQQTKREFNDDMVQPHVDKLLAMVKYNRDRLKSDKEYKSLSEEARLGHIQKHPDYKSFYSMFPSVTTYAISRGIYSIKVFKKYIKYKFTKTPTADERAELMQNPEGQKIWGNQFYATYVKWIYADKNPRCSTNELDKVYKDVLDALNEDTKSFFKTYEKEKEKMEAESRKFSAERRDELKDMFKKRLEDKLKK